LNTRQRFWNRRGNCNTSDAITFVITSCDRFDLLEQCLASFLRYNTADISRYLIIEDSGKSGVRSVVEQFNIPVDVIVNQPPLGQIASIDRAYQTIDTPYIFHCEDDWRFFRSVFMEESLVLLKHDPSISTVLCRRPGQLETHDRIFSAPLRIYKGIEYRKPKVWSEPHWLGYSFNPGLRRLSDYKRIGSFAKWGHEMHASIFFKKHGMTVSQLETPACETSGAERRLPKQKPELGEQALSQVAWAEKRFDIVQKLQRWTRLVGWPRS